MNELVFLKKDEALTDSLKVAEVFKKRHDNVLADIKNLDCSKEFNLLNFKEIKYQDSKGRTYSKYLITKDGFTFLVMGYRGKKAAKFKEDYISAFNKMEAFIREKTSQEWLDTRNQGKLTRRAETDTLKKLVEYAKSQGSEHADKLYVTYSRLANKMAGIESRDNATITQLHNLSLMENIILRIVDMEILAGLHYKEIYQKCKAQLENVRVMAFIGREIA